MDLLDHLGPLSKAFGLGILLHIGVLRNFELDTWIPHFIAAWLLSFGVLTSYHVYWTGLSVHASLYAVAAESLCLVLGIFTSMTIYRLLFHRIRNFPGPFWAKITRFYAVRLSAKNVQYYSELQKLREKYGDFIRTGPREICIMRKSAVPLILGPQSRCLRSTWYSQAAINGSNTQLEFVRDPADHKRRRKAWDQGFSVRALATYQPRIKSKVDILIHQMHNSNGEPMNATDWMMMLAFDIMGEVGFGKDFGGLAEGKEQPVAKAIHDHMMFIGVLGMAPWFLYLVQFIPGASKGFTPFFSWCRKMVDEKKAKWDSENYPQDVASWLIKAIMDKDPSAPPTHHALTDDARLIIIAGSDTSATSNACTLHYLTKHPHILQKLQQELDSAMPLGSQDWTYEKVLSVTYLDDVIRESLRLKPPVATGGYRITPPEGLTVDEVYIPGDVIVFTPIEPIQRDERYWMQANEFIPERWDERKEEMGTDPTLFIPFSYGTYKCAGDKLAMMGMRTSISSIVQEFDISFAPGETGEEFETKRRDVFTTFLPPLRLCFTPRKR